MSPTSRSTPPSTALGRRVCRTVLIPRTGQAWALPAADKKTPEPNASAIHDFLAGQTSCPHPLEHSRLRHM